MNRKIKRFGHVLLVISALGLITASAAQASELHVAAGPNADVFGEQTTQHVLTTDSGSIAATQALFESTLSTQTSGTTTAQELTLTPTYTGASAFGLNATIDMNGCEYTITGSGTPALTADVDIVCNRTAGKVIEVTTLTCTVTIPAQSVGGHVTFTNGPGFHVSANFTLSGITYEGHGFCPNLSATALTHNGTYAGGTTFKARVDTGSEQATHNGHTYQKLKQTGALVALTAT